MSWGGIGCHKVTAPPPVTAKSSDPALTAAVRPRSAADLIAESRCEREQQCGNVGQDKTYSSAPDCLARIQTDWKADLNARECPGGINRNELNECLTAIRDEACQNPFDALARITQCTAAQICIEAT